MLGQPLAEESGEGGDAGVGGAVVAGEGGKITLDVQAGCLGSVGG